MTQFAFLFFQKAVPLQTKQYTLYYIYKIGKRYED